MCFYGSIQIPCITMAYPAWDIFKFFQSPCNSTCSGHRTYVGYMYLEYTYNNAILRAFLHVLSSLQRQSSPATHGHRDEEVTAISQDSLTSKLSGMVTLSFGIINDSLLLVPTVPLYNKILCSACICMYACFQRARTLLQGPEGY